MLFCPKALCVVLKNAPLPIHALIFLAYGPFTSLYSVVMMGIGKVTALLDFVVVWSSISSHFVNVIPELIANWRFFFWDD